MAILKRDKCMISLDVKSLIQLRQMFLNKCLNLLKTTLNEVKNKNTSPLHQINMPVNY